MRVKHTLHQLPSFPVYSAAFVADDRLVLGGGGGSSRSGIKNSLRLYNISEDGALEMLDEYELEKDEDTPMSMAADVESSHLICGINSRTELLKKGINTNCRLFDVNEDELEPSTSASTLTASPDNIEDYQRVTVYSAEHNLVAVAGLKDLSVLSCPSLDPVGASIHTEHEIYDAAFTSSKLVIVTTECLLVYALPADDFAKSETEGRETRSKKKQKVKAQSAIELKRLTVINKPDVRGARTWTFRAARFLPGNDEVLFTVLNTSPNRARGKTEPKQGYVCKWNVSKWEVMITRKVGEKGITCFDISPNGKTLAFGSADQTVGLLEAQTLNPVTSILKAHDFPPTVVRFGPKSNLLVSGSVDNTLRIMTVPSVISASASSTSFTIIMALIVLFIAFFAAFLLNLRHVV